MISEPYRQALHEGTKLKLRASSILAEYGDDPERAYEAAVLFHESARAEQRALRALESPSPTSTLCSLMETCTCLIDGLDPTAVHHVYGEYLRVHDELPARIRAPLRQKFLRRLTPFLELSQAALADAPMGLVEDPIAFWSMATADAKVRARAVTFVKQTLRRFPGDPAWWVLSALLAEGADRDADAWHDLQRARGLAPDNKEFAMFAHVLAGGLPSADARRHFDGAHAQLTATRPDPTEAFGYVLGVLVFAQRVPTRDRRPLCERAARVASDAIARVGSTTDQGRVLVLLRAVAAAVIDGRDLVAEDFYRAGLSSLWVPGKTVLERQRPYLVRPFATVFSVAA